MEYYSQHGEDKYLIEYIKNNNLNIPKKMVDIGALTGLHNSNSRCLIENYNWECIMIEPNPNSFNKLKNNTKNFDVILENVAISNNNNIVEFIQSNEPGHSRIPNNQSGKLQPGKTIKVQSMTIEKLFKKYPNFKECGIMDIDVEGLEEMLLVELMKTDIRPFIIIVEHQKDEKRIAKQRSLLNDEYKLIDTLNVNDLWLKK